MSETIFYQNFEVLLTFATDIINFVNEQGVETEITPEVLNAGSMYVKFLDKKNIINGFIMRSYNYWEKIKDRDEDFLMTNCSVLFNELDESYIEDFNRLFSLKKDDGDFVLPKETRDSLWDILVEMIKCCIKYIHNERGFTVYDPPKYIKATDKYIHKGYSKSFFPEIKLSSEVVRFEVEF